MLCTNCGTENGEENTICVKCGAMLGKEQLATATGTANISSKKIDIAKMIKTVLNGFIKPAKTFKEEKEEYNTPAKAFTFAGILSAASILIYFFSNIIQGMYRKDILGKATFSFDNLKGFPFMKVLGIGLLISAGFILLMASIYYIAGLVAKKQSNYSEFIFASSLAVIPIVLSLSILAPMLGAIYAPLEMGINILALLYSILILTTAVNSVITFDSADAKIYFHLICLGIICVVIYFVYANLVVAAVTDTIKDVANDLNNVFNGLFE